MLTFLTVWWNCRQRLPSQPGSRPEANGTQHCLFSSCGRSNHRITQSTAGSPVEITEHWQITATLIIPYSNDDNDYLYRPRVIFCLNLHNVREDSKSAYKLYVWIIVHCVCESCCYLQSNKSKERLAPRDQMVSRSWAEAMCSLGMVLLLVVPNGAPANS